MGNAKKEQKRMDNPTKIIIIDPQNINKQAANYFGIALEDVKKRHIKMIKKLFNSRESQWVLAEERGKKLESPNSH